MGLTAVMVKRISAKGRYTDGGGTGLYLNVTGRGGKSWVQRISVDGKRRDVGLGSFPQVSLSEARKRATRNKLAAMDGFDPLAEQRNAKKQAASLPTFKEAALAYYELHKPNLRNGKHRENWLQVLERHAIPSLGDRRVDTITPSDVLNVLTPIWTSRPPTARRVRQRSRSILAFCMARGLISVNPAGESIDGGLPKQPRSKNHFRALHFSDVPGALETIDTSTASESAKLALRFVVLTACRSGEARGARWDEIDWQARTWKIPASRMKAGVEHRVPLSTQAGEVLRRARTLDDGSGLVFPSARSKGRKMSDMTLTEVLRRTCLADRATVHGFRTSFKVWTMEATDTPWAVGEAALAHTIGNSVEAAYARSDLFERRLELMQSWADCITGAPQ